jgi:hypothetical protein
MVRDGAFIWVACEEVASPLRTRLLLWHGASQRWVGQMALSLPVVSLAVDGQHLWVGADLSMLPNGAPVLAIEKRGLMAVPPARWVRDEISAEDWEARLKELPARERAVHAFFSGDAARVVGLLESAPPDGESLFLLAFAHDPLGLDDPRKREEYLSQLRRDFPDSPFAEVARGLKPVTSGNSGSSVGSNSVLQSLFRRRDTNGDGRISAEEWKEWKGDAVEMRPFDVDGNGSLGIEEFDAVLRGTSR